MTTANTTIVRRFFDEVCNGRKPEVADEIFARDHMHHDPANPGIVNGPEAMKQLTSIYQNAFSDALWTMDEMMVSGDRVIVRWTGTGTHDGVLAGVSPTGKKVKTTGIWIYRVAQGKIAESWDVWDAFGLFQQLGAVSLPGQAANA